MTIDSFWREKIEHHNVTSLKFTLEVSKNFCTIVVKLAANSAQTTIAKSSKKSSKFKLKCIALSHTITSKLQLRHHAYEIHYYSTWSTFNDWFRTTIARTNEHVESLNLNDHLHWSLNIQLYRLRKLLTSSMEYIMNRFFLLCRSVFRYNFNSYPQMN